MTVLSFLRFSLPLVAYAILICLFSSALLRCHCTFFPLFLVINEFAIFPELSLQHPEIPFFCHSDRRAHISRLHLPRIGVDYACLSTLDLSPVLVLLTSYCLQDISPLQLTLRLPTKSPSQTWF